VNAENSAPTGLPDAVVVDAKPEVDWAPLTYFCVYRLLLALTFIIIDALSLSPQVLGDVYPLLFERTALGYLTVAVVFAAMAGLRHPEISSQVVLQSFADILSLTLLMHASGGVNSGIGMLLVVAIAGASVLSQRRIAVLFAALASLAVLAEQVVTSFSGFVPIGNYTQAGFLGLTFFATATLAHYAASRVRASEGLAESSAVDAANLAQLNEHIIERMQFGIVVMDQKLRVHRFNAAAKAFLHLDDSSRQKSMSLALPQLWELRAQWLLAPERSTYNVRIDSSDRDLSVSFAALSARREGELLVFVEDAVAIVQRAQELKLASLGRLTASIAHEIRNPLSAINHASQLLAEGSELAPAETRFTEIIRSNALRVDEIVESVLQLSRRAPSEPSVFEGGPWLKQFVSEFRTEFGNNVDFKVELSQARIELRFDVGQLRQVLWNLCENSVRHGGTSVALIVRTGLSADGRRPFIETQDNGPGLDAEAARHIFEPFFTTRNDGTGLGLYIARELCQANQSTLTLRETQVGAVFRITFSDPRRQI